jgi:hypothetical protein
MRSLAFYSIFALGGALALNAADTNVATGAEEDAGTAEIIAVQIRKQGFQCGTAQSAKRDTQADRPDLPVWILKCDNASDRVRHVGNMADHVEPIE